MFRSIIKSVPFAPRLRTTLGARKILERDHKRAAKFLAGSSPHGPRFDFRRQIAASPTYNDSIDVTDSGGLSRLDVGSDMY